MLLAVFPLWGDPRSFSATPRPSFWKRFWAGFALVSAATTPWVSACRQLQSMFVEMNKAEAVSAIGHVAFEQLETMLEFSGLLYAAIGWSLIAGTAAIAMLIHRLEIVVTQLDVRARPRVGFRFHMVQISSMALYLGLLAHWIAWTMNHRSFAEPLLYKAFNSPLILVPGILWLLLRPWLAKNRRSTRRKLYGNARRALMASIISTVGCVGVSVAMMMLLGKPV